MKNEIPKICFFDMEGTLLRKNHALDNGKVAPSAWTTLAKAISEECYEAEELSKEKWLSGGYGSYTDWMYDSILIQKKHGLTQSVFEKIVEESELQSGAKQLVDFLHENGVVTVLISGGFKQLADNVQIALKIRHSYSACEYFFNSGGSLEHFNLMPTDEKGKLVFMQHLAEEYSIDLSECMFIGDGKNDVHLAEKVGCSIAFNGQPELVQVSSFSIEQSQGNEDLSDIIELFN